nr:HEAT repeat-containing protein 3-like [Lytechinus pictus]
MGKSKNKRFRSKKAHPTGLESVKEIQAEEEELGTSTTSSDTVQLKTVGVLEKLQSSSAEERECACTSLANLVQDPQALQTLVQQKAVRSLGPLLVDPSSGIREAAAGALRNLTVAGGHDICDHMIDEDIMTPLVAFLLQYSDGIPQTSAKHKENKMPQHDSSLEALVQAVHLVWNLCESNSTAVAIANQQGLVTVFLHCLQAYQTMVDLAICAAQCLHTFTEDNLLAAQELCKPDRLAVIESALMCENSSMKLTQLQTLTALTEVHLTRLCSFGEANASNRIKVNLVGVLGSIGSVLAKRDSTEELLMAVGNQLLEVATKDGSLWVAAEALDAIFDTFGDGVMADRVAIELGLTARLKALVPQLKSKLRQCRGTLGEHLPIIMNARTNLGRFIKYKENQELLLGTYPSA